MLNYRCMNMESLWKLLLLLDPSTITLIFTAVSVTLGSALRAQSYGKKHDLNRDSSQISITIHKSHALMVPLFSSCSLLVMFYLFSHVSHFVTVFSAIASTSSLFFCFSPYITASKSKSFTRSESVLLLMCLLVVLAWLMSGNWILSNLLGISVCVAFVSHIRLQNIKVCSILLICLFLYDIFWVFYSERFFGENVMVSVATQQASNPVHVVANTLSLPGLEMITQKLELPVKIVFPSNLLRGGGSGGVNERDFLMLGIGDMAIPSMLFALVLCFDHKKSGESLNIFDLPEYKGNKYIWYALSGYIFGLVAALAAGILTRAAQPALLYLVPSALGPIIIVAWLRSELHEMWDGRCTSFIEKV